MYAGGRGDADARWFARFWGRIFGAGLLSRRWVTLEVPGRTSGKMTSFPLGMADVDGRWYLVSMLGECNWVANVRVNEGHVVLRRRRRRPVQLVEVPIDSRAAVLSRYVHIAPGGRPHISVSKERCWRSSPRSPRTIRCSKSWTIEQPRDLGPRPTKKAGDHVEILGRS